MAIQHRRGVYDNFDPNSLRPGEWAVVLSGDSTSSDGMATYMCFAAGVVKRMATFEDMVANIANADEVIIEQLTEGVSAVEDAIEAAEALRVTAEQGRASAESARVTAEQGRVSAETARDQAENGVNGSGGRVQAEAARVAAEEQRVLRFAEIEQIAQGWTIHHCSASEYDSATRKPTVSDPDPGTLYCVPNVDESDDDAWIEWRYDTTTEDFEHMGSTTANTSPITTSTIDSITSDISVTGDDVLKTTGLTYFWSKLRAAFAAITHYHTGLGNSNYNVLAVNVTRQSVTEGATSTATGSHAHAEGASQASGSYSHAEGYYAESSGDYSHAEGREVTASGDCSHAEGLYTTASGDNQHVSGKYNATASSMAEIVGNGTSENARSNARTLDWSGNEALGTVNYGTSSTAGATAAKVAEMGTGFCLVTGARVSIKFSYANTVTSSAVTLNVNSTGAKTICVDGVVTSSTNKITWSVGAICDFVYDGTYWNYLGNNLDGASGLAQLRESVSKISVTNAAVVEIGSGVSGSGQLLRFSVTTSNGDRYSWVCTQNAMQLWINGVQQWSK